MRHLRSIFLWLLIIQLSISDAPMALGQAADATLTPLTPTINASVLADPTNTAMPLPASSIATPSVGSQDAPSSLTPLLLTPSPTLTLATSLETTIGPLADDALDAMVEEIFAGMSLSDRVGQLFVITFDGANVGFESPMAELIHGYRVGGVVLRPQNYNFSNEPGADTPRQAAVLANQLQGLAYGVVLPTEDALQPVPNQPWPPTNLVSLENETGVAPPNIPLLIGVEQLGDNLPATALRRGFTPLPSQLAVGATWSTDLAQQVGGIVGRELSAVGVNLLLGPVLDVVDQPRSDIVGSLGLFSFGGDPFWVSQLGRAYIAGVHRGGDGQVATIVRHFPGQGDIDRLPEEEVATIPKSLDELTRIALPPFLAVTTPLTNTANLSITDGLMSSNMRFDALQGGTGRAVPFSLDTSLTQALSQSPLADWRASGGVVMSGPLGAPAIRKYYDPTLSDFPVRLIALDAFLAGNDLLFLDRFSLDDDWRSELDNIRAVIAFFQERYRTESEFAAQVDAAVRRILKLKLRLYSAASLPVVDPGAPSIPLSRVLVQESDLTDLTAGLPEAGQKMAAAAREALVQLSPDPALQANPPAPRGGEQILIITDSRLQHECESCIAEAAIDPDAIERAILALYGPEGTGQILPEQLTSITFADLMQVLVDEPQVSPAVTPVVAEFPAPTTAPESPEEVVIEPDADSVDKNARIETAIAQANWLIFAMLDVTPLRPNSEALRIFLNQRSEQLAGKQVVVFALNAPYFLDTTEISKLALYLGASSKTEPFLENAVRGLFRTLTPTGAPSVSVPGTRFKSLEERLLPNPAQVIPLRLLNGDATFIANDQEMSERSTPPVVSAGQSIRIDAGPIMDANGHFAPDGVVVNFDLQFEGADLALAVPPALTQGGAASRDVRLERGGVLRVSARAGEATSGEPLMLTVIEPQPTATPLVEPTPTPEPPPVDVATTTITSTTATVNPPDQSSDVDWIAQRVNIVTLLLSLFAMGIILSLALLTQGRNLPRRRLFTGMLWAIVFGLMGYLLYGLGWLPGGDEIAALLNVFGAPVVVICAMSAPLAWTWLRSLGRMR
jgi:beta-N-acetylhexosaminidase